MASILERIQKRKAFPVETSQGTFHVCEPTFRDIKSLQSLDDNERKVFLAFGLCLVDENGDQVCQRVPGESDSDFADRVATECGGMTMTTIKEIEQAMVSLSKPVKDVDLAKNS